MSDRALDFETLAVIGLLKGGKACVFLMIARLKKDKSGAGPCVVQI